MSSAHDRLRRARIAAGYQSITATARAFGWNRNTYKSHENGARGLRPDQAQQYARALGVSASWLLTGDNPPKWAREHVPSVRQLPSRQVPMVTYSEVEVIASKAAFAAPPTAPLVTIPSDTRLRERVVVVQVAHDLDAPVRPGDFVLARRDRDDEPVFRRYQYRGKDHSGADIVDLTPLNDNFDTVRLDTDNPGRVIGRVMKLVRDF